MAAGGTDHAVVVGASMAGLTAATALSRTFGHVTVLDRDRLPVEPVARAGVPQGRHTHGLLARGLQALEQLYPGLGDELVEQGARRGDLQRDARWLYGLRPLAPGFSGLEGLAASRPLLETAVRRRVAALPGVELRPGTAVLDLLWDRTGRHVRGVEAVDREAAVHRTARGQPLDADLVVDAGGRCSRLTEWLGRQGYAEPVQEVVRVEVSYATRTFRRTDDGLDGAQALVAAASADNPRAAAVIAQEGGRWSVSLGGYHGERPPVELAAFRRTAHRYGGPWLAALVADAEPLDAGAHYRFAASRRRRFDRLRLPEGVVAVGDAISSFDPVYGQGMTVAALEALVLEEEAARGTEGLGRRFFARTAPIVDVPWTIAANGAFALPGAPHRPPAAVRATNRYLRAYLTAAAADPELARGFVAVANLAASPASLLAPNRVARVLARLGGSRSTDR